MVNGATSWFIVDERISECKEEYMYTSMMKDSTAKSDILFSAGYGTSGAGGVFGGGPLGGVDWSTTGSEDFMGVGGYSAGGETVFYDAASFGRQTKRSKNRGSHSRGYGRY